MEVVLGVLLLVSTLLHLTQLRVLSRLHRENVRLRGENTRLGNKLEDGEAVGRLPHEDPPISLLRIRQDR